MSILPNSSSEFFHIWGMGMPALGCKKCWHGAERGHTKSFSFFIAKPDLPKTTTVVRISLKR